MSDYDKIILEMKREDDIRNANQSLLNDGVSNPNVQSGGAAAAILHTEHPAQHEKTWEEMDRVDQTIDALETGYLGLKKAKKVAEMVDAFETSEAGFATLSEDIDGTDDESKKAVEALLSKDTQANRQYKNEASDRAMRSAFEYRALLQEDTKHRVPADIKAMQERTKDMGFWEALSEGTKLFLGGDVIGNSIYLAGTSFGAIAPYVVMAAVGNKAGAVTGGAAVGRAIGGAVMGYGSYQNEYGAYIAEKLQERGFDLSNPEDWKKAVRDQALIDDIKYRASNRAATVSAFDGLAGYAATLHFNPSQLTSKVRKAFGKAENELNGVKSIGARLSDGAGNLVAQSGLQGVLGGAGEAFGSLAAGDEVNAADVLMEMLGEFTSGPLDTLSLGVSSVKEYRNDIEKAEMAVQFEKAATQFSAAAEAISNDLKNEEAVDAWAERVGEDKSLIAFGQDVVDYVDMEALKKVDPKLAEKVVKAQEQKQSVEISVSRIAKIATKDRALANALIHEGKVDVAGMTPREAEEFEKTGKAEAQAQFDKILAKTKVSREQLKEAREVTAELSKQLQEAGEEKSVADLQVKPWEMILANRARMLGESPKALAQRMNVRVVRGGDGKVGVSFASPATQGQYWSMGPQNISPESTLEVLSVAEIIEEDRKTTLEKFESIFSKGLQNNQTGWIFTSSYSKGKRSYGASGSVKAFVLRNILPVMDKVVANSVLLESHRDVDHKSDNVKAVHVFATPVRIGEKIWRVELKVKDIREWHRKDDSLNEHLNVHSVDSIDVKEIKKASHNGLNSEASSEVDVPVAPHQPTAPTAAGQPLSINFSEFIDGVNPFVRKDGRRFFDEVDESSYRYNDENPGESGAYALMWSFGQIQDGDRASQQRRGSYVPANTSTNTRGESGIISLMEKSDKSTFLHESAHAWLDFDTRLAMDIADKFDRGEALTEGEQEFLRTLGGFFKWGQQEGVINLGVTDDPVSVMRAARTWSQISIQDQTAMHELFANGFERYMIDGSFPSLEVKNLFQRFKKWLLDVYKSVANQPKPISNEVKKLYDLLFVSEQEVNDAEIRAGMVKLFVADDAKIAMTDEERKQYDQLNEDANLEAQGIVSKAVSGVMRLYTKFRQKEAQSIYKANQKRIDNRIAELQEEPRYVALDILTKGLKQADGSKIRYKLNADALRAEGYSQETINTLAEKGFIYDGREHAKFISPRRLAEEVGAEDALDLMKQLAGDERAKNHSPLAKARLQLSWSYNFKLNARELKALGVDDETMAKLLERGYVIDPAVKPGTCSAQQLAEVSGHNFPAELIGELLDIQDVTQEATEQVAAEIKQETGESPEVYTQLQADLAAHNATRSKLLHAEHNAIARMLGKKQLAVKAAREYAQQKIQGMKLNELSAYIFIRNEKKCARLAEQAYIKGDFATCLEMKRGQILNMEMARAALEVQERYEKSVRMARNAVKSKTIHKPYQKLATLLIANHGITGTRGADIAAIAKESESLVKELEDNGTPIEGLQEMLKDTTPVRDMTVEEADNLCSAMRELISLGRNFKKQELLKTKMRIGDIIAEGKEMIAEAASDQGLEAKVREEPKGEWEVRFANLKQRFTDHIKIATWCRIFDQNKENGFFWNLFIRTANERAGFENEERAKVATRLSEILTPVFGNKGAFDQDFVKIGKKMMSKGERFAAACNLGNDSNRERLIKGEEEQWTEEAIEELCSSLTTAEWEAVQQVWDLFESYRPMIAAKQKRVYGEEPKWIEPKSFEVTTKNGDIITVPGGYYPVKYDRHASLKADHQDDATKAAQELRGAFQSPTTSRSFVKSRVEVAPGDRLRLNLDALYSGLDDVIHDLAWHEWLIETRRVLVGVNGSGTGLESVIRSYYGTQVSDAFDAWRADIAQGDRIPQGSLSKLSGNIGAVAMGWSPMSAIVQLTGIGYAVPRCGAKNVLWALKKFLTSPAKSRQVVNAASKTMANRALTMNKQISQIKNRIASGKPNWVKEHAYCMIVAVQGMVDTITWMAAYASAMQDESVINSTDPDATAVAVADQVVIDTQSSGNISDMSKIERDPTYDILTVFYSWSNAALNQSYAIAKGERNRSKAYRDLMWMGMFMPILEQLYRGILKAEGDDEDEDDEIKKLVAMPMRAVIEYHLGMFVGIPRELSSSVAALITGEPVYRYSGPSGVQAITSLNNLIATAQNPTSVGFGNALIDVASAAWGLPGGQIKKTIKGIRAIESGQAEGLDAIKAPIFGFTGKIED